MPVVNMGGRTTATALYAGNAHTCAIRSDGTGMCWGSGGNGRLGQGSGTTWGSGPNLMANLPAISIPAGLTFSQIYPMNGETCMVANDQVARCFGQSAYGALGQGQNTADTTSTSLMGAGLLTTPLF